MKAMRGKRAAREGAPNLSREAVVQAARDVIDRDGLEGFSIRLLAAELGVYPTAIYWYVPTRNDILAQVVALILEDVPPRRRRREWQRHLEDFFRNFREAIRTHPEAAPLIGSQLVSNTTLGFAFVENLLDTLSRASLRGTYLLGAYNSVVATMVGYVAQEFAPMPKEDPAAWQISVQRRLLGASRAQYPTLVDNLPLLSNHAFILRWQNGVEAPLDESYEIHVQILIGGIERLIARQAAEHGVAFGDAVGSVE